MLFRVIDAARGHNYTYESFEQANSDGRIPGGVVVKAIIYPPGK